MSDADNQLDWTEPKRGLLNESQATRVVAIVRLLSLGILGTLMVRIAWISDDSLITLRTALNLAHGWGPGYNATEAVQAYTHPLWFLLWLVGGAISHEWILTIAALGIACSLAAASIALRTVRSVAAVILVTGALGLSNAFMEYTTSGLENPLAYLMVGATLTLSLRADEPASRPTSGGFALLGVTLAGVALTRLDLLLIALPAALVFVRQHGTRVRTLLAATTGFVLPLVAWFTWSYITYAALLPNTFEAKRNLVIPIAELVVQGCRYLWVSIEHDPVTGLAIAVGLLVGFVWGSLLQRAWAAGVLLYLAYVVYIGGDFMTGRFLAVPAYIAVLLAASSPMWGMLDAATSRSSVEAAGSRRAAVALIALATVMLLLAAAQRQPVALLNPDTARWDYKNAAGVADERGFYMEHARGVIQLLMALGAPSSVPPYQTVADANVFAALSDIRQAANGWPDNVDPARALPDEVGVKCGLLGAAGIMTGPRIHWIDQCALTDRFLAEQQYSGSGFRWRVGHYRRRLPDGYIAAVAGSDTSLVADPAQAQRLANLWSLIRD